MTESDPRIYPEETVDELERRVLDGEPGEDGADSDEPAFDQDMDVKDLPGGAGEGGGRAPEPPA